MLERAATVSNISMGTVSISLADKVAVELEREKEREEAAAKIAAVRKGQALLQPRPLLRPLTPPTHLRLPLLPRRHGGSSAAAPEPQ